MMTSQELIAELSRRGYRVNSRLLTKWRHDGLLPPMARARSDLDRRPRYVWDDSGILDHAVLICELLSRHRRVDTALLGAWFAGYEIDLARVCKAWRSQLEKTENAYNEDDVLVVQIAEHVARQEAPRLGVTANVLEGVLLEVLPLLFTKGYHYKDVNLSDEIIEKMKQIIRKIMKIPSSDYMLNRAIVENTLRLLQEVLSLASIRELVASAAGNELAAAHRRWRNLLRLIGRMANAAMLEEASKDSPRARMSAVAFGRVFILALLYLEKRGVGSRIDATLESIRGSLDQLPDLEAWFRLVQPSGGAAIIPDELASNLRDLASSLRAIWGAFDYLALLPSGATTLLLPLSGRGSEP